MTPKPESVRRLLILSYEYPPLGGGTAAAIQALLREYGRDGSLQVDLVTSHAGTGTETEQLSETIRAFKLPVPKRELHFWRPRELALWIVRASRFVRRQARETSYELCHCWSGWPSSLVGYQLRRRVPYVVSLRGSDVPGYSPRLRLLDALLLKRLSRRLWRRAAAVVAVSDHLRSLARRTTPALEIGVIRNGVDTRRFTPAPGNEPTVLFVGRLIPRKGVAVLLEAFRAVAPSHPEARLIIAGDGPERERLEELSRRHGIETRVEFRGFLARDALPGLYHEASIFVSPALEEAMPNVVLEAMASGLPVVTTHSGADEILQDNGTLVDPGDAGALAAALGSYLADGARRRREGQRSRELADRLSWPTVAESYRALYERILAPTRVVE